VRSPATSTEVGLGVLVLADISGFTEFVTATELEHGPPIIAELLGEVMRQISPPLEIQEVEGDAVFAVATDRVLGPPATLLDVLEDAVAAFRNRQRELDQGAADECHFGSVLLDVMRDALAHKCRHLSAENKQESCATQEPWDQPHESALWSLQQKQRADDRPYECHDEEWAQ